MSAAVGSDIGSLSQDDLSNGDFAGASAAQAALHEVQGVIASGTNTAVLDGAKWDQQVVTWSLADSPGTGSTQFSGSMDSSEAATVQQAFDAWGAATGLQFKEAADSSQSDIRLGWEDFNTATTGVIGYTTVPNHDGQIQPGAIVRLEDPSQDALVTGADGQQTYAGTDATLSQVLTHEIGHALGFGDNANPNSIMSYYLGSDNRTLDSVDLAGASALYGTSSSPAPSTDSSAALMGQAQSLLNAMASFSPATAPTSPPPIAVNNNETVQLAVNGH
ncbi:MAG: matrixin family metalloprotease [Alphaproteobacteria bacterium]|nr:matrixin family metalloprotease [Alphaproteobacteria bacterium]